MIYARRHDQRQLSWKWYHDENRLTQSVIGGNTSTYAYTATACARAKPPAGRRPPTPGNVGSALPVILQETAGAQTTYYVYGLDLIARIQGSTATYYLTDGLGSTAQLADGAGAVTGAYTYDAFGPVRTHTGASTEWTFTGEQNDPTGLEYLRARYYDPAIGRFLTKDPWPGLLGYPQSLNRYPYVLNNPLLYRDPYGYWPSLGDVWDKAKDVAGAAADIVTNPENTVSGVQLVSGVVMVGSCAEVLGGELLCLASAGVYGGASLAKTAMAGNTPERIVVAGTSLLGASGAVPGVPVLSGRVVGVVIAALSDLAESVVRPSPPARAMLRAIAAMAVAGSATILGLSAAGTLAPSTAGGVEAFLLAFCAVMAICFLLQDYGSKRMVLTPTSLLFEHRSVQHDYPWRDVASVALETWKERAPLNRLYGALLFRAAFDTPHVKIVLRRAIRYPQWGSGPAGTRVARIFVPG